MADGNGPQSPGPRGWRKLTHAWSVQKVVRKWPFALNLALCVLVAFLGTIWFWRHMQNFVVAPLITGGLISVATFVRLVVVVVKWGAEDQAKTLLLPTRLLATKWSGLVLVALVLLAFVLNVFTSSLYLEYATTDSQISKCTVAIVRAESGTAFHAPIALNSTSDDKLVGRPYLFRVHSEMLRFDITQPPGFQSQWREFRPWTRLHLRAPVDFEAKLFRIVRVVFGPRLWRNLPERSDSTATFYDLKVTLPNKSFTIADVRRETLWVGAKQEELDFVAAHEEKDERKRDFAARCAEDGLPTDLYSALTSEWDKNHRTCPSDELPAGANIKLALHQRGTPAPLAQREATIDSTKIQTILLEM